MKQVQNFSISQLRQEEDFGFHNLIDAQRVVIARRDTVNEKNRGE